MTMPVQQVLVAGPPGFITISNVVPTPTATGFQVAFDTDAACEIQMVWWPTQYPNTGPGVSGGPADSTPVTHHVLGVNIGPSAAGLSYQFILQLAASDPSGLQLRAYQGSVQVWAKYNRASPALPVRWNNFGDGTAPPHGGGTGPTFSGPAAGNWSTYQWAQYNPKGTAFPTP